MQPIASWLVAKPQNAVLALAFTLVLSTQLLLGGAIIVLLVLYQGVAKTVIQAAFAIAIVAVIGLVTSSPPMPLLIAATVNWLPMLLLGFVLGKLRSFTLTLQLSVLGAVVILLAVQIYVADNATFGEQFITDFAKLMSEAGNQDVADVLLANKAMYVGQLPLYLVFAWWQMSVLALMLGYTLIRALPGDAGARWEFGRICDLSYGKVLAIIVAIASVMAWLVGQQWLQNLSFLVLAAFWIQGLAIIHWLCAEGRLPVAMLVMTYVVLPFLSILMVVALAVAGYLDAWFQLRRKVSTES